MAKFERVYIPEKIKQVEELKDILANNSVVLADFQGVDVVGMADIRKALKPTNATFKVVKNTLLTIAANESDISDLVKDLSGSTAIMYTPDDPIAATKALMGFVKVPK
ncbi:MAG: 50S ribosomal protein L10, partial [Armatimonadetes bacterium]|nr:50S ribosomal protein L10 [Candidatus Hippobium faecium]